MRCLVAVAVVLTAAPAAADPCDHLAPGDRVTCAVGERTYRVVVPERLAADPPPVVVNLHGRGGGAREQESRLVDAAERDGYVLVSPEGFRESWNAGVGFGPAHETGVDDVAFLRGVIDDLARRRPIDRRRVFATGFSNGGRMVHRLACEASDVFAAVASVAGPLANRQEPGAVAFECKPPRAVPVMIIHGTADTCTPYAGGRGLDTAGNLATPAVGVQWAAIDGCSTKTRHPLGSTTCQVYGSCADGAEVAVCTVERGGHVWPGGKRFYGWQICGGEWPDDFDASGQMWGFFSAHPLPGDGVAAAAWQPAPLAPGNVAAGEPLALTGPVDSVELPFDHSQVTVAIRATIPHELDGIGTYQDGAVSIGGALSIYSRLRPGSGGGGLSALRVLLQFRLEGEGVRSDAFAEPRRVGKISLGGAVVYLSPALNVYALCAGVAVAQEREVDSPSFMPVAIGLGTWRHSARFSLIYGGGLGYAAGRPWVLPAAGLLWKPRYDWTITTILPIFVDVRRSWSKAFALGATLSVSGDRFDLLNRGDFAGAGETLQLRAAQAKLTLGASFRLRRRWTAKVDAGIVAPRRLAIRDGDTEVVTGKARAAGVVSTSLTFAFGDAPF